MSDESIPPSTPRVAPPAAPLTATKPLRRAVAVVAVHGVGDHEPGSSAQAIADLLLRMQHDPPRSDASKYTSFFARPLRIPTRPALVGGWSLSRKSVKTRASLFAEQAPYLRELLDTGESLPERDAPNHDFMRAQLEEYESTGAPYETTRLEGQRLGQPVGDAPAAPEAVVHVYEMFWSDLARIGGGFIGLFGALYQILFHIPHLGRLVVEQARLEHPKSFLWKSFGGFHQWAVRLLTMFVPVVWLVMLGTITGLIVLQVPGPAKAPVIVAAVGVLIVTLGYIMAYRATSAGKVRVRPIFALVSLILAGLVAWPVLRLDYASHVVGLDRGLLAVWFVLSGALLHLLLKLYERTRPGIWAVGMVAYALAALAVFVFEIYVPNESAMMVGIAHVFETETVAIMIAWYLLYATGTIATVLGWIAKRREPNADARDRTARVAWTARATLALCASLVLVITFVMWAAVYKLGVRLLPETGDIPAMIPLFAPGPNHVQPGCAGYCAYFEDIIRATAGPGAPTLLLLIASAAVIALVALLPAVFKEVMPPRTGEQFSQRAKPHRSAQDPATWWKNQRVADDAAERLGAWLSGGMVWIAVAVNALFFATFVFAPTVNFVDYVGHLTGAHDIGIIEFFEDYGLRIILFAGGTLTAATIGLVAFRQRLDALALGFRPVLDAALAVDNYMREHPRAATPRAKIVERYVSLLRYLCHWRDDAGAPYAAIVIVSHSQGTVITADLLDFVQRESDPELEPLRKGGDPALYFFTMGTPLRQLYGECFPHLYGWVLGDLPSWYPIPGTEAQREAGTASGTRSADVAHHVDERPLPRDAAPDPARLGVRRWVNAYRTGDYVGRSLWRIEDEASPSLYRCAPCDAGPFTVPLVTYVSEDASGLRRELCLGAGAHTHYWDATARGVATEIDLLLAEVTAGALAYTGI